MDIQPQSPSKAEYRQPPQLQETPSKESREPRRAALPAWTRIERGARERRASMVAFCSSSLQSWGARGIALFPTPKVKYNNANVSNIGQWGNFGKKKTEAPPGLSQTLTPKNPTGGSKYPYLPTAIAREGGSQRAELPDTFFGRTPHNPVRIQRDSFLKITLRRVQLPADLVDHPKVQVGLGIVRIDGDCLTILPD